MSLSETLGGLDQTLIQALTAAIETTINTALSYDPASLQKIAQLDDILEIESTTPSLHLYFQGQEDGVRVMSYCEHPISTHLKGSPLALVGLLKQPTSLANSGVSLVGSSQLLQQWQEILQDLDIDWEEAVSSVLGDVAGPLASKGVRQGHHYAKSQLSDQARLIREYLTEEMKLTPSQDEAEYFFEQIDELKLNVDRLGARIDALIAKQAAKAQDKGQEKE